jgi:hypothetical protein
MWRLLLVVPSRLLLTSKKSSLSVNGTLWLYINRRLAWSLSIRLLAHFTALILRWLLYYHHEILWMHLRVNHLSKSLFKELLLRLCRPLRYYDYLSLFSSALNGLASHTAYSSTYVLRHKEAITLVPRNAVRLIEYVRFKVLSTHIVRRGHLPFLHVILWAVGLSCSLLDLRSLSTVEHSPALF